jgi:ketosteroid isomerase-like protein
MQGTRRTSCVFSTICGLVAVLTITASATDAGAITTHSDSAAVRTVVERFHSALAAGDSVTALSLLTGDVLVIESGGIELRADYRAHHLPADIEFARAVRGARSLVRITIQGTAAWVVSTSTTKGRFKDRVMDSSGAELMVLRRTPQGWRIAAIHWSSRRRPAG